MPVEAKPRLSIQQYLALERQAETKNEYLNGEMLSMAASSRQHNLIVVNVLAALHAQLRNRNAEVCASSMRVRVPATNLFTYPDVVVVWGQPDLDDAEKDTLLNPKLIVEVLSKSTEDYDRGTKFAHYRMLASLSEYVLIAQDKVHVEHFTRQGDGRWLFTETDDPGSVLELPSIGCRLVLAEVYEQIFQR